MKNTNAKLRGWMAEHGISGRVFAEMIEMSYDTFKVKMTGKTDWKLSEVLKILKVTGQPFENIF